MTGQLRARWSGRRALRATTAALGLVAACHGDDVPTVLSYAFVRVEVLAYGLDADLDGYAVTVDDTQTIILKNPSGLEDLFVASFQVEPGTHAVAIANVAANCSVTNSTTRTVSLAAGERATVKFDVVCVQTGTVLTVHTSGPDGTDRERLTTAPRDAPAWRPR